MAAVEDYTPVESPPVPSEPAELNLLLQWPGERSRSWRQKIIGASLGIHLLLLALAIQLPSFVSQTEPERTVVVHRIPLYIPPDILTQRERNRQKPSKTIDLADLRASRQIPQQRPTPAPSVKHFEVPKQVQVAKAKAAPQILPEAPQVTVKQPAGPPPGSLNGVTAPPPPAPAESPFQDVGADAPPPNRHPTLAPPKNPVQAAINGLSQSGSGQHLSITDDNSTDGARAAPGSPGTLGAHHAAVELQSDPEGADFKPYLMKILAIVRANWRRVIPESARMGTLRGRTTLEFIINRDGTIPKMVTADSSGSDPLDRAAVAGLSMSNPLPPLPADYKGFQVRLAFSFSYNMPSQ